MTIQNVIDVIATQLAKQRRRSVDRADGGGGANCQYRGHGGSMCAVGCLIPDNLAALLHEGQGVRTIMHDPAIRDYLEALAPDVPAKQLSDVLTAFQVFHDRKMTDSYDRRRWGIARSYTTLLESYPADTDDKLKERIVTELMNAVHHHQIFVLDKHQEAIDVAKHGY